MRNVFIAAAALAALTTTAQAEGMIGPLTFGGEVESKYNVDQEIFDVTLTPEVAYGMGATELTLSTDLTVWNSDTEFFVADHLDTLPTLDFGATYQIWDNTEAFGEVSYDLDTEVRGDIEVGVSFNF